MIFWAVICLFLLLFYSALISFYLYHWKISTTDNAPKNYLPDIKISVIIPARNEEENILSCLNSVLNQNYPEHLLEVIVIDDFSTDGTAKKVLSKKDRRVRLLSLASYQLGKNEFAYKKKAIELAVQEANGELIVTTDADCVAEREWLKEIAYGIEIKNDVLITGPVLIEDKDSFLSKFQTLDFISMIAITASSIRAGFFNLANGANLAFRKDCFINVRGYQGIDFSASGDDMFLIYKIAKAFDHKVSFLKSSDAIVKTKAMDTWSAFVNQRFRWTSKSFQYQDKRITLILALVFFFNVSILINVVLIFFCDHSMAVLLAIQLTLKLVVDFVFLNSATAFFNRRYLLKSFFLHEVVHIIYIVFVGAFGNLLSYNWKGRKLK